MQNANCCQIFHGAEPAGAGAAKAREWKTADQYFTNNSETKARKRRKWSALRGAVAVGPSENCRRPASAARPFPAAENPSIMQLSVFQQIETEGGPGWILSGIESFSKMCMLPAPILSFSIFLIRNTNVFLFCGRWASGGPLFHLNCKSISLVCRYGFCYRFRGKAEAVSTKNTGYQGRELLLSCFLSFRSNRVCR